MSGSVPAVYTSVTTHCACRSGRAGVSGVTDRCWGWDLLNVHRIVTSVWGFTKCSQ